MAKEYKNQNVINDVEKTAQSILDQVNHNRHRDHFFPLMINNLSLQEGVEIGTDKGEFANHILSRSNLKHLHCVDPWIDDFGSNHRPGFFDKNGMNRMQQAQSLLQKHIDADRCILHKDYSANVSEQFERSSLDFVYIDGAHDLEGIYTDVYSWVPKVRIGGIIAGHDYKDGPGSGIKDYFGNQLPYKIKTVVNNFCLQYGFKLNIVGGRILSWWFVKNN